MTEDKPLPDFALVRPMQPEEFCNYPRDAELVRAIDRLRDGMPKRISLFVGDYSSGKTSLAIYYGMWATCGHLRPDGLPCGNCEDCRIVAQGQDWRRGRFFEIDATDEDVVDQIHKAFNESGDFSIFDAFKMTSPGLRARRPGVIFADEAHRITPKMQDRLLKLTERNSQTLFVFATTELDKIDGGLRSRAADGTYHLTRPLRPEMVEHLHRMAIRFGGTVAPSVAEWIAMKCADEPRSCLSTLHTLMMKRRDVDEDVYRAIYGTPPSAGEVVPVQGW